MNVCDYTSVSLANLGVPVPHQVILRKPARLPRDQGPEAVAARQAQLAAQLRAGLLQRGRKRARGQDAAGAKHAVSKEAARAAVRRLPPGLDAWEIMGVRSEMYLFVSPRDWLAQLGAVVQTAARRDYSDFTLAAPQVAVLQGGRRFHAVWKLPHVVQAPGSQPDPMGVTVHAFHSVDGSCSFKLIGGAIRFACDNGCVVGAYTQDAALRHLVRKGENHAAAMARVAACVARVVGDTTEGLPRALAAWGAVAVPHDPVPAPLPMNVRVGAPHTFRELVATRLLEMPRYAARHFLEEADQHGASPTKFDLWNAATAVATHHMAHAPAARADMDDTIRRVFQEGGSFDTLAAHRRRWPRLLASIRARRR